MNLSANRFFNVQLDLLQRSFPQNYSKDMILIRLAERWEKIDIHVEFNVSFKENIFIDVVNEIYGDGTFADYLKMIGSEFPALKLARFMIGFKTWCFFQNVYFVQVKLSCKMNEKKMLKQAKIPHTSNIIHHSSDVM